MPSDDLTDWQENRMAVIGEDGEIHYEYMDSLDDASIVGSYWNAVDDYLRNGNTDQFEQFEEVFITTWEGETIPMETNLDVIDELYEAGEIGGADNEEFYVYEP